MFEALTIFTFVMTGFVVLGVIAKIFGRYILDYING